jgi:hypothetical protein
MRLNDHRGGVSIGQVLGSVLLLLALFALAIAMVIFLPRPVDAQQYDCMIVRTPGRNPPPTIPESAKCSILCVQVAGEAEECETVCSWCVLAPSSPLPAESPLPVFSPLPPPTPLPVMPKMDEEPPTTGVVSSGWVNGVWVPVYGLSCDQVYEAGDPSCMCFYGAPVWCPE